MNNLQVDFEAYSREFNIKADAFISAIESLSKNELERVLKALTLFPLKHENIKLTHRDEIKAFDLGVEIFTAKVQMTVSYMGEHAQKGTEMIIEAEGSTPEEKVANAKIKSKKMSDEATLKDEITAKTDIPAPPVKEIKKIVEKKPAKKVKKDEV